MRTIGQALNDFFSSFGLPAYPTDAVPDDVKYPWITYEYKTGSYGDEVSIAATIWYHTESEATPNAKAKEIGDRIGLGGIMLEAEGGAIWLKKDAPWCQSLTDENDRAAKGRQLLIRAEFLT